MNEEDKQKKFTYHKHNYFFIHNFVNTHLQYQNHKPQPINKFALRSFEYSVFCGLDFHQENVYPGQSRVVSQEVEQIIKSLEKKAQKYKILSLKSNLELTTSKSKKIIKALMEEQKDKKNKVNK